MTRICCTLRTCLGKDNGLSKKKAGGLLTFACESGGGAWTSEVGFGRFYKLKKVSLRVLVV